MREGGYELSKGEVGEEEEGRVKRGGGVRGAGWCMHGLFKRNRTISQSG